MAIKTTYSGQGDSKSAKLEIDNGDLQALTQAASKYGFVDEQALLRYALVALLNSDDNNLYVRKGDSVVVLKANESLLKHPAQKVSTNGETS